MGGGQSENSAVDKNKPSKFPKKIRSNRIKSVAARITLRAIKGCGRSPGIVH